MLLNHKPSVIMNWAALNLYKQLQKSNSAFLKVKMNAWTKGKKNAKSAILLTMEKSLSEAHRFWKTFRTSRMVFFSLFFFPHSKRLWQNNPWRSDWSKTMTTYSQNINSHLSSETSKRWLFVEVFLPSTG